MSQYNKEYVMAYQGMLERAKQWMSNPIVESIPVHKRAYGKQFMNPDDDWNSDMLSKSEKEALKQIAIQTLKKGKNKITYEDYNDQGFSTARLGNKKEAKKGNETTDALKLFLGNSRIVRDGNDIYVADQYDFNPMSKNTKNAETQLEKGKAFLTEMSKPKKQNMFGALHTAGELWGLRGHKGEGAPVRIKIGSAEELGLDDKALNKLSTIQDYNKQTKTPENYKGTKEEMVGPEEPPTPVTRHTAQKGIRKAFPSLNRQEVQPQAQEPQEVGPQRQGALAQSPTQVPTSQPVQQGALSSVQLERPQEKPATYKIQRGDSLSLIAKRLGVPIEQLQRINNIQNPNLIYTGQTLRLQ